MDAHDPTILRPYPERAALFDQDHREPSETISWISDFKQTCIRTPSKRTRPSKVGIQQIAVKGLGDGVDGTLR